MTEETTKKKIAFILKSDEKTLYYKEVALEGYHMDAIKTRALTFYYFFKDLALSLEEKLEKYSKSGDGVVLIMECDGRVINKAELELTGIKRDDLKRKSAETMMYFFFSGVEDSLLELINNEHKEYIMETVAIEFSKN